MPVKAATRLIVIPAEQVERAWNNWLKFHYGIHCDETETRFFTFLDPDDSNEQVIDWDEDEDLHCFADIAHKLRLLSSPHFHAVIHAHYVQHPWKVKYA